MAKLGAPASSVTRQDVLKLRGRALMKSHRGDIVIQKWPRRRGRNQSPIQKAWNDRFSCLARALSSPDPRTLDAATGWAKGQSPEFGGPKAPTGWYYRDVLESAAFGKLIRYQGEVRVRTPTVEVTRASNQSIAAATFAAIIPTAVTWDNNLFWSSSINPSRLTMRAAGLYLVGGTVDLQTANAGFFSAEISQNGGASIAGSKVTKNGLSTFASVVALVYCHVNDYVELKCFNSANTTNFRCPSFWAVAITPEALIA